MEYKTSEQVRKRALENYYKNRESKLAYQKEYIKENKEKWSAYAKEYQKKNRDKINARQRKGFQKDSCVLCGVEILKRGGAKYCSDCKLLKQREWTYNNIKEKQKLAKLEKEKYSDKLNEQNKILKKERRSQDKLIKLKTKELKQKLEEEHGGKKVNAVYERRQFKLKHPESYRLCCKKSKYNRRANEKKIKHSFTAKQWKVKLDETKGFCPECKEYFGTNNLTLDHILPISKAPDGFEYTINDVQPLCLLCNSTKRDNII